VGLRGFSTFRLRAARAGQRLRARELRIAELILEKHGGCASRGGLIFLRRRQRVPGALRQNELCSNSMVSQNSCFSHIEPGRRYYEYRFRFGRICLYFSDPLRARNKRHAEVVDQQRLTCSNVFNKCFLHEVQYAYAAFARGVYFVK
jgi:hypothetical protein